MYPRSYTTSTYVILQTYTDNYKAFTEFKRPASIAMFYSRNHNSK